MRWLGRVKACGEQRCADCAHPEKGLSGAQGVAQHGRARPGTPALLTPRHSVRTDTQGGLCVAREHVEAFLCPAPGKDLGAQRDGVRDEGGRRGPQMEMAAFRTLNNWISIHEYVVGI